MAVWRCKVCRTGKVTAKKPAGGHCTKRPKIKNKMQPHVWIKEKS
jgi:hypothetical protein